MVNSDFFFFALFFRPCFFWDIEILNDPPVCFFVSRSIFKSFFPFFASFFS